MERKLDSTDIMIYHDNLLNIDYIDIEDYIYYKDQVTKSPDLNGFNVLDLVANGFIHHTCMNIMTYMGEMIMRYDSLKEDIDWLKKNAPVDTDENIRQLENCIFYLYDYYYAYKNGGQTFGVGLWDIISIYDIWRYRTHEEDSTLDYLMDSESMSAFYAEISNAKMNIKAV